MTLTIQNTPEAEITLQGYKPSEHEFDVTVVTLAENSDGTTEDVLIADGLWRQYTGATQLLEAQVQAATVGARFGSLDPEIGIVDADTGRVTRVADGIARVVVRTPQWGTRANVTVSQQVEPSASSFLYYDEGSLGRACRDTIHDELSGITHGGPGNPEYYSLAALTWNPNLWAIQCGIKIWPIAFTNSLNEAEGLWGGCTAVHPRFGLVATHYPGMYNTGRTHTFLTPDNVPIVRTVVDHAVIIGDMTMVQFDSDLPEEIGFARVLPDNWREYFPSIRSTEASYPEFNQPNAGIPTIRRNRDGTMLCWEDWIATARRGGSAYDHILWVDTTDATRYPFNDIGHDGVGASSNSHCIWHPEDKYLIVLAVYGGGSPDIVQVKSAMNAVMDDAISGASLTDADFTGYPTFS